MLGDGTVSFAYDEANEKGLPTLNGAELSSEYEILSDAPYMANIKIELKSKSRIRFDTNGFIWFRSKMKP